MIATVIDFGYLMYLFVSTIISFMISNFPASLNFNFNDRDKYWRKNKLISNKNYQKKKKAASRCRHVFTFTFQLEITQTSRENIRVKVISPISGQRLFPALIIVDRPLQNVIRMRENIHYDPSIHYAR